MCTRPSTRSFPRRPPTDITDLNQPGTNGLPDWARAGGSVSARASMRVHLDDFRVDEELGFEPAGDGQHDYLHIEKIDQGTDRVAGFLARYAGVKRRAVGFAGMKDRRAVTRQWFSVERRAGDPPDWSAFRAEGVNILAVSRGQRKLRRGAHRGNRFELVLRDVDDPGASLERRLERVRDSGIPNYFGEQRFGHGGGNIELAATLFAGGRLPRHLRSIAISAARSLIFNDLLSARVEAGTWDRIVDGDIANLAGSGSLFSVDEADETLEARCAAFDIHPTGPLWGRSAPGTRGDAARMESQSADRYPELRAGLERIADESRRALRAAVSDLDWSLSGGRLVLRFGLGRGSYATAVVREIVKITG